MFAHAPGSFGNQHTTLFIFCFKLLAEMQSYTSCETHTGGFEVRNSIALTVTVCITSFEVIGELQRKILHQSHATAFS